MNSILVISWGVIVLLLAAWLTQGKDISSPYLRSKRRFIVFSLIPVVAIAILIAVVFSFSTIHFIRFSHAVCVLGLWLSGLITLMAMRAGNSSTLINIVRIVFTIGPAVYLTPVYRFESVFSTTRYAYPLVLGLLLVILYYLGLFKMRKNAME